MTIGSRTRMLVNDGLNRAGQALGQRRAERLGRTIHRGLRLVGANDIHRNGEELVMDAALTLPYRAGSSIFDVGANVGDWAEVMAAKLAKAGQQQTPLHCFEPSPTTFKLLSNNPLLDGASNVSLANVGLSSRAGEAKLSIVHNGAGSNSLHRHDSQHETVSLVTLDHYVSQASIKHIRLLKMDVEGHELAVLEGATRVLAERRIDLIQFEYTWRWIDARRYLRDAFELLQRDSYQLFRISRFGFHPVAEWTPSEENYWEVNYLAALPSVRDTAEFGRFVKH